MGSGSGVADEDSAIAVGSSCASMVSDVAVGINVSVGAGLSTGTVAALVIVGAVVISSRSESCWQFTNIKANRMNMTRDKYLLIAGNVVIPLFANTIYINHGIASFQMQFPSSKF